MTLSTYTPAFVNDVSVIPAAALNLWRLEMPMAIDGAGGGSYAPTAPINIQGAGLGTAYVVTLAEIAVGGQLAFPVGANIPDADTDLTIADGQVRACLPPNTVQRDHSLLYTGVKTGSWIHVIRPAAGGFPILLHRYGEAQDIVSLPAGGWASATCYVNSAGLWRLRTHEGGIPGAHA